jgi:hypothetical protein
VANVIDLGGRKKRMEDQRRAERVRRFQSTVRCVGCGLRCAKCGLHAEPISAVTHPGLNVTVTLCPDCLDEYTDLTQYAAQGFQSHFPAWYNREWFQLWMAFLEYQAAASQYLNSAEVLTALSDSPDGD